MEMLERVLEVWASEQLTLRTVEHLGMFAVALSVSVLAGLSLGAVLSERRKASGILFNSLNVIETIPTLALLVLLMPLFGIGRDPTIAASVLYSLLPIARNTYAGLTGVRAEYVESGRAMGLSEWEIAIHIKMPMAMPMIVGGIRMASVYIMGIVTLGGLIAAGGLGAPIQTGIYLYDSGLIVIASCWVALLAILFDGALSMVERWIRGKVRW